MITLDLNTSKIKSNCELKPTTAKLRKTSIQTSVIILTSQSKLALSGSLKARQTPEKQEIAQIYKYTNKEIHNKKTAAPLRLLLLIAFIIKLTKHIKAFIYQIIAQVCSVSNIRNPCDAQP